MKPLHYRLRILCLVLGTLPALGMSGCRPSDLLWFGAGALVASQFQTTTTEYRCFRDGVEVDCSTLPDFGD